MQDKEWYLGIDPGLQGSFVVVSGDKIVCKMVMPTISHKNKAGKTKTEIDRDGVLSFLSVLPPHTHVAIEEVQAYRKQNITATCTTCRNYGMLLMALTVAHMRITEVHSGVWQSKFGIFPAKEAGGKSTKEQAFNIARMIYPGEVFRKSDRSHTFHTGIVDAALIAKYCQFLFAKDEKGAEWLEEAARKLGEYAKHENQKEAGRILQEVPLLGADLKGLKFESIEDEQKRIQKEKRGEK